MGQQLLLLQSSVDECQVSAALVSTKSAQLGHPATATCTYQTLQQWQENPTAVDVWIDFSLAAGLTNNLQLAVQTKTPIVVCTTGLSDAQQLELGRAGEQVAVLYAANTSIGIAVLQDLVRQASAALPNADIEILEAHHKHKLDAPSGTAKLLAAEAELGRQQAHSMAIRGDGKREPDSIGFAVIRGGDIVGEHSVFLISGGERLEFTHRVSDRSVFARGALQAAQWLSQQVIGYYQMADLFRAQR